MAPRQTNPQVDAFLRRAKAWRKEMEKLRSIILRCPLVEELKWGKPCYTFEGKNVVLIVGFKEHCALLLCKGALLKDPQHILIKAGEHTQAARQIRFRDLGEIDRLAPALKGYLDHAVAVEKAGLEVEYRKPTDIAVPEELQRKFKESSSFQTAFQALTPGRQRAYIIHFSGAKQPATRASRIEKCRGLILAGKGLHDEYRASCK